MLTNPADTQSADADDAPVLEADEDNILESALAQTWDWLDNATDDTWAESTTDWFVNHQSVRC